MKTVKTKMDVKAIKALVNYQLRLLYILYPICAAIVLFGNIQSYFETKEPNVFIFGATFAVMLCFFMWFFLV